MPQQGFELRIERVFPALPHAHGEHPRVGDSIVLLPEGVAAVRAARHNRVQTSLNLAIGSAIASIGLTIPIVAAVTLAMDWPLHLGIDNKSTLLLLLTLFVAALSLRTGRTTVLHGLVHLVLFAAYVFLSFVP